MTSLAPDMPVLQFLQRHLAGTLNPGEHTHMRYPTAISQLLNFELVAVGVASASLRLTADVAVHGNQQGTVHGGLLVELADAAIGTAASTVCEPGESFTTVNLSATFLRPVWSDILVATARRIHAGRTINHYTCEVARGDGKPVATVTSAVMTLRGEKAQGR